jgi:uncharacterized protein (TIGR02996 family)
MASSSSPDRASIRPEVRIFFRDIKEHPDDDAPRLIFADWLQEHGDAARAARGEYLRLRVLRHHLSPDDPGYDILKRREGELFSEYRWTWLGPLADQARLWHLERGLIQIEARADKVLTPEVATWAETEAGLWLDALTLADVTHAHVSRLESSPLLAHLNALHLTHTRLTTPSGRRFWTNTRLQAPFRRLFRSRRMASVTRLFLAHNHLTAYPIAALAQSAHFHRLTILDLQYNWLDDMAARLLADSPYLKNLTALRLGHNRFTAEGMALLRQAFGERVSF